MPRGSYFAKPALSNFKFDLTAVDYEAHDMNAGGPESRLRHLTRRLIGMSLAGLLGAVGSLVTAAPPVQAGPPPLTCQADDVHLFAGAVGSSPYTMEGIFANPVYVQQGALCIPSAGGDGLDAMSMGWNMLVSATSNCIPPYYLTCNWVQSGWMNAYPGFGAPGEPNPGSCWSIFSEDWEPNANRNKWVFPVPALCINNGDRHTFWQKDQNCGCGQGALVNSGFDNSVLQTSSFNPLNSPWTQPDQVEVFGETVRDHSDVPGYPANKSLFQNIQVQRTDGSFYYACNANTNSTVQVNWAQLIDPRYSSNLLPGYCPGTTGWDNINFWTSG